MRTATSHLCIVQTTAINHLELTALKQSYWRFLEQHPFPPAPNHQDTVSMLNYLKRDKKPIGPYLDITVFEAANRIATDLIIINGLLQLTAAEPALQQEKYTLRLGNQHKKGQGDFSIGDQQGEAFNVAPSFLQGKLSATLKKWRQEQGTLSYIFVNAEVADLLGSEKQGIKIIKVYNWQKP